MVGRIAWTASIVVASGCAYLGAVQPAPLYRAGQQVPCQYDVVTTLRLTPTNPPKTVDDLEDMRAQMLGMAALEVGADAVLVESSEDELGGWRPRDPFADAPAPTKVTFEGTAIRYRLDSCRW